MNTATLVGQNLSNFCPITNHYQCSDGTFLLVTLPSMDVVETLGLFGVKVRITKTHLPTGIDVFLSDEFANVLDADGDLSTGLTPLAHLDATTHDEALAELGYAVTNPEEG